MISARVEVFALNTSEAMCKADRHFAKFFENEVRWEIVGASALAMTTHDGNVLGWSVAVEAETK